MSGHSAFAAIASMPQATYQAILGRIMSLPSPSHPPSYYRLETMYACMRTRTSTHMPLGTSAHG